MSEELHKQLEQIFSCETAKPFEQIMKVDYRKLSVRFVCTAVRPELCLRAQLNGSNQCAYALDKNGCGHGLDS